MSLTNTAITAALARHITHVAHGMSGMTFSVGRFEVLFMVTS
jgi:hypothetical protein